MSMHSRLPMELGSRISAKAHFRVHESGGICLDIPVFASLPGQLTEISPEGGVCLRADAVMSDEQDEYLKLNEDGSVSIRVG